MVSTGVWFAILIMIGLLAYLSWRLRKLQILVDSSANQTQKLSEMLPYLEELPLFREGKLIQYRWNNIEEEWEIAKNTFFNEEWSEIKAHMATNPSPDQPFIPSEGLLRSLKWWAEKHGRYSKMAQFRDEYKQFFADVMAGKISVEEAESSINRAVGSGIERDPNREESLIKSRTEKWSIGEVGKYFEEIKESYSG